MPFPTTEQYMDALQFPSKVLKDPELAAAKVETTGMGLPFARSGGFALTFKLIGPNKVWALRLFQKNRDGDKLGERYGAISRGIKNSGLPYFVEFSFLPAGISIQTQTYSCVKMGWAEGTVLGTFIEKHKNNKPVLNGLEQNILKLSEDMTKAGLAHGDLQTDNVLVSSSGVLKFVDYDAFFVPEVRHLGAIEVGYPNFQHPERGKLKPYDEKMDRFSFLVIHSALKALQVNPALWDKVGADPQGLLIRASDFAAPHASVAFHTLALDPQVGATYKRLAAICEGKYQDVPTLAEFLSGKGPAALNLKPISKIAAAGATASQTISSSYQSRASKVISGADYATALGAMGQHVEIVGKVISADARITRHGKPYVFILFGPKTGKAVYIPIWSEGLLELQGSGFRADASLVGKWISVTGIMDATKSYSTWQRTGITVVEANMIMTISETEAKFRLAAKPKVTSATTMPQSSSTNPVNKNQQIAAAAKAAAAKQSNTSTGYKPSSSTSRKPSYQSTSGRAQAPSRAPQKSFLQKFLDFFS
jgi:serine/threonine protein kinase